MNRDGGIETTPDGLSLESNRAAGAVRCSE
jgi:hypothetical protein